MARTPVYHVRWMIRRDMAEVMDIEREAFEFPWEEDDLIQCLRQNSCIGMVAEQGDRVLGFVLYELHKYRLHVLNLAVAEQARRRGVGTALIAKLVAKLHSARRFQISAEIRERNLPAQKFFAAQGFKCERVLKGFYEDSPEDAYVFQWTVPECRSKDQSAGAIPLDLSQRNRWVRRLTD